MRSNIPAFHEVHKVNSERSVLHAMVFDLRSGCSLEICRAHDREKMWHMILLACHFHLEIMFRIKDG